MNFKILAQIKTAKTKLLLGLTFVATFLFAGCLKPDERQAGVDDFPNSVQAQVVGFLDQSQKSQDIGVSPIADSLLVLQGFNVGAAKVAAKVAANNLAPTKMGMLKMTAQSGSTIASTCASTLKFDTTSSSLDKITVNSILFCMDAKLTDSIKGNETVLSARIINNYANGSLDTTLIQDADGDGFINPVANQKSKTKLTVIKIVGGITERTELIVGPGPDNNFDTEADNIIYGSIWTKTKNAGKDTLATAAYTDADGDSIVIDNSKPSLVDLDLYQVGPTSDHADAIWSRAQMRIIARYGVKDPELKRVHFELEKVLPNKDRRFESADLLNLKKGKDINTSDTLLVKFLSIGKSATDTLDSMAVTLKMRIGPDLNDKRFDKTFALDIYRLNKLGEEKSAIFSFISDSAIASGKDPEYGKISMKINYIDSSTLTVDGKLESKALDVIVKDRDDKKLHVVWDALGRGVSLEVVP